MFISRNRFHHWEVIKSYNVNTNDKNHSNFFIRGMFKKRKSIGENTLIDQKKP